MNAWSGLNVSAILDELLASLFGMLNGLMRADCLARNSVAEASRNDDPKVEEENLIFFKCRMHVGVTDVVYLNMFPVWIVSESLRFCGAFCRIDSVPLGIPCIYPRHNVRKIDSWESSLDAEPHIFLQGWNMSQLWWTIDWFRRWALVPKNNSHTPLHVRLECLLVCARCKLHLIRRWWPPVSKWTLRVKWIFQWKYGHRGHLYIQPLDVWRFVHECFQLIFRKTCRLDGFITGVFSFQEVQQLRPRSYVNIVVCSQSGLYHSEKTNGQTSSVQFHSLCAKNLRIVCPQCCRFMILRQVRKIF